MGTAGNKVAAHCSFAQFMKSGSDYFKTFA